MTSDEMLRQANGLEGDSYRRMVDVWREIAANRELVASLLERVEALERKEESDGE